MTEVNFRNIPSPRFPENELASEPWYSMRRMMFFLRNLDISCVQTPNSLSP